MHNAKEMKLEEGRGPTREDEEEISIDYIEVRKVDNRGEERRKPLVPAIANNTSEKFVSFSAMFWTFGTRTSFVIMVMVPN